MRFAYADPPYIGCAHRYPEKTEVDHAELVARLIREYPDGWALSCSTPSLDYLVRILTEAGLYMDRGDYRIGAWVKPFAVFKPNVNPAFTWEPVIFCGGRLRTREQATVRDHLSKNITMRRGLVGVKPDAFYIWLLELLNVQDGDEIVDLFPGSHGLARVRRQSRLAL